jgi:anti-sigma factor RsiW
MNKACSEKDWLLLSGYLDGVLPASQVEALKLRLSSEPVLSEALTQIRRTRALLASLPQKQIPHNFTLSARSLTIKHSPRLFPAFRLATVICSILFVITIGFKTVFNSMQGNQSLMMAMPAESLEVAPKISVPSEDTARVTAEAEQVVSPLTGLGAPAASLPTQEITVDENYYEEPVFQVRRSFPWRLITWVLGTLSILLCCVAVSFYFQERH